jgi:hypothetical protein
MGELHIAQILTYSDKQDYFSRFVFLSDSLSFRQSDATLTLMDALKAFSGLSIASLS